MRWFRLLTTRIVLANILVASLTSVIGALVLVLVLVVNLHDVTAADYVALAKFAGQGWLFNEPDGQPNPEVGLGFPAGFHLVVSGASQGGSQQDQKDNEAITVLFSQGDTPCRAGMALADCAPDLRGLEPGERKFEKNGEQWAEVVIDTVAGNRVISRRGPPAAELFLLIPGLPIYGTLPFTVFVSSAMAVLSVPVALTLALLIVRPLARRLSRLMQASRTFARGNFKVRVKDRNRDQIGQLAQQFDDMADTLEQNFAVLRELAERNTELARQAEESAIQAERARLSRDLHDAIAQRLFSLSVSTATLPDLIQRDQAQGVQQARAVAGLAEQALLDLRSMLVELRPASVIQRGLADALEALCDEWQNTHAVPVERSIVLTGQRIPASLEDVIYRVAQEALNNVAKHTNATLVTLSLVKGQRQVTLSITDNGQGFDPEAVSGEGKFGLISMRERARSAGGSLSIESNSASDTTQGTTLRMVLPLQKETVHE